jgi:mannose-6-phosphate isomerase
MKVPNYLSPFQVLPTFKERVWGTTELGAWFPEAPQKTIGEAWFTAADNSICNGPTLGELLKRHPEILGTGASPDFPGLCPLLVKLLFTTGKLSVQVHPPDEYAREHHQCLGKTEAWYVVRASPGAAVALGFKEEISPGRFRSAAVSGEIEALLSWRLVQEGDFIFVPAGTVHAMGAGLTICEIQQNSDITYRLYDYGRPRELHLEHGSRVADLGPYAADAPMRQIGPQRRILLESGYFCVERLSQKGRRIQVAGGIPHYMLFVCIRGEGSVGGQAFREGQVWLLPAGSPPATFESDGAEWLLAYSGGESLPAIDVV